MGDFTTLLVKFGKKHGAIPHFSVFSEKRERERTSEHERKVARKLVANTIDLRARTSDHERER